MLTRALKYHFSLIIMCANALLTQLDRLKSCPNVFVLTTSNITGAIGKDPLSQKALLLIKYFSVCNNLSPADIAFVDRADIKAYVGPPSLAARYEILRSCVKELYRVGLLTFKSVMHGSMKSLIPLVEIILVDTRNNCLMKLII